MVINQNKKLTALWHESKKMLGDELKNRKKLDKQEHIDEDILDGEVL